MNNITYSQEPQKNFFIFFNIAPAESMTADDPEAPSKYFLCFQATCLSGQVVGLEIQTSQIHVLHIAGAVVCSKLLDCGEDR